jgi:hypothetical protein
MKLHTTMTADAYASSLRRQAELMDDPEVLLYAARFIESQQAEIKNLKHAIEQMV